MKVNVAAAVLGIPGGVKRAATKKRATDLPATRFYLCIYSVYQAFEKRHEEGQIQDARSAAAEP